LPPHLNYVAALPCKCTQRIVHVKLQVKKVFPYNICCNFGNCSPILKQFRHIGHQVSICAHTMVLPLHYLLHYKHSCRPNCRRCRHTFWM